MADLLDADALAARFDPPTVRLGGRVYRGRILSIEEWDPFQVRIERIRLAEGDNNKLGQEDMVGLFREYGHTVFGRRRTLWERVLQIPTDPTERLMRLPPSAMLETFLRFFSCQARAMGAAEPSTPKTTILV